MFNNISNDEPHIKKSRGYVYSRIHKSEQIDKYQEYLAQADDLNDDDKNPRNFFDELNSADTRWLTIARMNLSSKHISSSIAR